MNEPRSRRLQCNGIDLRLHEWTPAGAPVAVAILLHGLQDDGRSFDLVAPALTAAGLSVIAPDLRGFGDSARVPAGAYYHFADYVFDLADLVDQVSPRAPVFLVGHSMGGTVASLFAGAFPERVALLALLEGVGPPTMPDAISPDRFRMWITDVRDTRARQERTMSLDEATRRLAKNHPRVDDHVVRERAERLTRPAPTDPDRRVWSFDPLHRTTSPFGFCAERWKAHAVRITAPTLIVGGGTEGFHPEDEAARVSAIPCAKIVDLPGAGHMMHWTKPRELAALLIEFLNDNA